MVVRPLVGWAFPSSRPAKIGRSSDLDANGAGSLTLWLIQSFSGRKANQATMRIGRPIAIQTHFRRKNPISFSIRDLIHAWRQGSIFDRCHLAAVPALAHFTAAIAGAWRIYG